MQMCKLCVNSKKRWGLYTSWHTDVVWWLASVIIQYLLAECALSTVIFHKACLTFPTTCSPSAWNNRAGLIFYSFQWRALHCSSLDSFYDSHNLCLRFTRLGPYPLDNFDHFSHPLYNFLWAIIQILFQYSQRQITFFIFTRASSMRNLFANGWGQSFLSRALLHTRISWMFFCSRVHSMFVNITSTAHFTTWTFMAVSSSVWYPQCFFSAIFDNSIETTVWRIWMMISSLLLSLYGSEVTTSVWHLVGIFYIKYTFFNEFQPFFSFLDPRWPLDLDMWHLF